MPHIDLLELPYFEGISLDDVAELVDKMQPGYFAAGSVIVQEGAVTPPSLYIVTAGRIHMSKRVPGSAQERALAEPNCPTLFGEIELLCDLPPIATIRAVTAVTAFALSQATFATLQAASHIPLLRFVGNVARVACHRLAIADELLVSLLRDEDLVTMRQNLFAKQGVESTWTRNTGVFKRPVK